MAKKKSKRGHRKSGRLTKAEIKKAGSIKAAWQARKARTKTPRKAARKSKARKSTKRAAPRKARKSKSKTKSPRKAAKRASSKRAKKSGSRKARRSAKRRSSRKTRRSVSMKLPRRARKVYVVAAERKRSKRRGKRRSTHRAAERRHPRRHRGKGRRRGAMENPMTGVELFVGGITGLLGFGVADAVDRLLATQALTDKGTKDANGYELYANTPPSSGDYAGLYNPTAICAPMGWKRWVFGLLGAAVPLGIAQVVSAPTGRAALQFFGFGYGVRVVGKGLIDGLAALTVHTGVGQRLYDGEMRAAILSANNGDSSAAALASLPAAMSGAQAGAAGVPGQLGKAAPCNGCADKAAQPNASANGTGYPSMPREVASQATAVAPPPSAATPPSTAPTPPARTFAPPPPPPPPFQATQLTGAPANGKPARKNPFAWGEEFAPGNSASQ